MTTVVVVDQLRDVVGREIAVSDWIEVSQSIIDEFAEATRDAQWIHVDTERAARESPFRRCAGRRCTVAHGFLTLSLLTVLIENCLRVAGVQAGMNIGFDRVRFVAPVPGRQPAARPLRAGASRRRTRRGAAHLACDGRTPRRIAPGAHRAVADAPRAVAAGGSPPHAPAEMSANDRGHKRR